MKNTDDKSFKKGLLILIIGGLIGLVIYNFDTFKNLGNQFNTTVTKPVVNKIQEAAPQYAPTINKKVGEKFTLWDMEYQVVSANNAGSSYGFQKSTGKYIVLKIKVTNVGKVEKGLNKIYLKDSKDRQYNQDDLAFDFDAGYKPYGLTSNYTGTIAPGFSETFVSAFQVPLDSTGLELDYPSAQGTIVLSVKLGL